MNIDFHGKEPKFEDVYPKAPFSELIRLSISFAANLRAAALKLRQLRWRMSRRQPGHPGVTAAGQ